jgi:hypothetical protein
VSGQRCALATCGRPAHDGLICQQHTWELHRHLTDVPALFAELDITLSRQSKSGPATEKVTGKGETAVAFNTGASTAATDLRRALIRWARMFGKPDIKDPVAAATHLLAMLPELGINSQLPNVWQQIVTAHAAAERSVDAPANRTVIPVGPCPETDEHGTYCLGNVLAFIPSDERPARMACTITEGHWWSSIQWLRAGKRILDLAAKRAREERLRLALYGADR